MANETIVNVIPEGVPVPDKKRKLEEDTVAPPPVSKLLIKRLSEKARLPTRGSAFAAGYDLYRYAYFFLKLPCISNKFLSELSAENKIVPAKSKALVDTQISIAVPQGCYGRVAPRSGLGMWSFYPFCNGPEARLKRVYFQHQNL